MGNAKGPLTAARGQSTYSRIIVRAMQAAKAEASLTRKVRSATRELLAMVPHTRDVYRGLPPLQRALAMVSLLLIGVAVGLGLAALKGRPNTAEMRRLIQQKLVEQDFVAARDLLGSLKASGELTELDEWQLRAPTQAGFERLERALQGEVEEHRRGRRFDAALGTLKQMDKSGMAPAYVLFTRAEVLREAGRADEATRAYQRYAELYPDTDHSDDAWFWVAASHKAAGRTNEARQALGELLRRYPTTNFKSSAKRWLLELAAPSP